MHYIAYLSGLFTQTAHAANPFKQYCDALGPNCGSGTVFIVELAVRTEMLLAQLLGGAATLAVIYGAIMIITSSIDESRRDTGKKVIQFALIGLVLVVLAHSIIYFIGKFVAGTVA